MCGNTLMRPVLYGGVIKKPSRTTLWRRRTGRTQVRALPPPPDPGWMRLNEDLIMRAATWGARQAEEIWKRKWGQYHVTREEFHELVAVAAAKLCSISGDRKHRDTLPWLVVAARNGCLSHIRAEINRRKREVVNDLQ